MAGRASRGALHHGFLLDGAVNVVARGEATVYAAEDGLLESGIVPEG